MGIAWRFVVPRSGYFGLLRVARACPEIRSDINKIALYSLVINIGFVVALPFVLIGILLGALVVGLVKIRSHLPDFAELQNDAIKEMHWKVPVEEIRRRVGLDPERGTLLDKAGNPVGLSSVQEMPSGTEGRRSSGL